MNSGDILKKHLFFIIYTFILTLGTILSLLATFVFSVNYEDQGIAGLVQEIPTYKKGKVTWTDTSYEDDNISIKINIVRRYDTTCYLADVKIKHLAYLQAALAKNEFGRNIREYPTIMAKRNHAILAINGDYYGFRDKGLVIRNGVLFDPTREPRKDKDLLIIDKDGRFNIIPEEEANIVESHNAGAWQSFCFGPGLLIDGNLAVGKYTEVDAYKTSNPRTAIGYIDDLHYMLVVSDGRTETEKGLSLLELAKVMQEFGCVDAYNLDGGGSSVMIFNDKIVNKPTSDGEKIRERSSSDIVYIGY